MSSSSSSHATKQLTPTSDCPPRSPDSIGSDEDLDVHPPEDGFELRQLPQQDHSNKAADNERGRLLASGDGSDDEIEGDEEEVLYDAFGEGDGSGRGQRRTRRATSGSLKEMLFTPTEERVIVRKLDRYLVGSLAVLYMLSFLDRSNIGNAKIAGLMEDLDLTGDQYELILGSFYLTYIVFEWMTLLWKVFPAHSYVACTVVAWGMVASLQALSTNWFHLSVLRALLGICEAAFGPGVPFYLSLFYRREELALRIGLFISAAPLATAYAGFLAYAITSIPSPIASWRLLFILEGFPSVIAGFAAFYMIPDSPGDAWFLNARQKRVARQRLLVVRDDDDDDSAGKIFNSDNTSEGRGLRFAELWPALLNPGNWITAFIFFFANVSFASLPIFLPTIIHIQLGYTSTTAQALSVPPYLLAFALILIISYLSDRYRSRSIPLLFLSAFAALGYILLFAAGLLHRSIVRLENTLPGIESPNSSVDPASFASRIPSNATIIAMQYTGVLLTASCIFSIISLVIVWNGNNSETESGRGMGQVMLQILGQCGPLVGTRLYPEKDRPEFIMGSAVCAGCMCVVGVLVAVQRWRLRRENDRREKEERREVAEFGEKRRRRFRFML